MITPRNVGAAGNLFAEKATILIKKESFVNAEIAETACFIWLMTIICICVQNLREFGKVSYYSCRFHYDGSQSPFALRNSLLLKLVTEYFKDIGNDLKEFWKLRGLIVQQKNTQIMILYWNCLLYHYTKSKQDSLCTNAKSTSEYCLASAAYVMVLYSLHSTRDMHVLLKIIRFEYSGSNVIFTAILN